MGLTSYLVSGEVLVPGRLSEGELSEMKSKQLVKCVVCPQHFPAPTPLEKERSRT